jgi:hypothetical protein
MGQVHATHVANAYPEDIWVSVRADVAYAIETDTTLCNEIAAGGVNIKTSGGRKTKYDWTFAEKYGFTRIGWKGYTDFQPTNGTGSVHITILSSSGRVICVAHPKRSDYSVIVTKDGYLVPAQYGKIWVDTMNVNHYPR